jgi:hypothetical protein
VEAVATIVPGRGGLNQDTGGLGIYPVPDRRTASEADIVAWMGAWAGTEVLGERVGRAIVEAAPVTVRVPLSSGWSS